MSAGAARGAEEGPGEPAEMPPQRQWWRGRESPAPAPPRPPLRQNGVAEQTSQGCEGSGEKGKKINHSPFPRASRRSLSAPFLRPPRTAAAAPQRRQGEPRARSGVAAAGPGTPPHLPLWRSREEPGGSGGDGSGSSERGGQMTRMYREKARTWRGGTPGSVRRGPIRPCASAARPPLKVNPVFLPRPLCSRPSPRGRGEPGGRRSGGLRADREGARLPSPLPRPP